MLLGEIPNKVLQWPIHNAVFVPFATLIQWQKKPLRSGATELGVTFWEIAWKNINY